MARLLLAPAALVGLVFLIYWKLFVPGYVWFDQYDLCQSQIPRLQFIARSLHDGHFPLWNPHSWAGLPVLGSSQPGPAYPLNLLMVALPLRDGALTTLALNLWFLATHILAAWFCYLLLRDIGLRAAASILGGISFSTLGFLGWLPWIDVSNGVEWTPLLFLFFLRLSRGVDLIRNAAMLGLALGMSWLSGHHEIPLLNSYALLVAGLVQFVWLRPLPHGRGSVGKRGHSAPGHAQTGLAAPRLTAPRLPSRDRKGADFAGALALSFALGAAVSAIQTLPVWEFGQHAKRWVGAPEAVTWQEKVPYEVHARYSLQLKQLATTPEAYIGWTIGVLAILGAFVARARFFLVLGIAAFVFALGASTPMHRLLYELLPMLDKARTPSRALFLVSFAVSVLAAFGADAVIARSGSRGWVAAALMLALLTAEATTASARRVTPLSSAICATALRDHRSLVEPLASAGRVTVNRDEWLTNPAELYGFDQLQGFVAGAPANMIRHETHTERTQQLFGVSHHIGKTPAHANDEMLMTDPQGMKLFRKRTPLARAWVVHEVISVANDGELRKTIQDPNVDLSGTAPMMGAIPQLENCFGGETVRITRPNSDQVRLDAQLACRGMVVLSDTVYPGWEATLDGRPVPIVEAYGSLRGVVADAGAHVIEMRYRPSSVRAGAILTLAGLALAIICIVRRPSEHDVRPELDPAGG